MALVYDPESGKMITEYELLLKQQAAQKAANDALLSGAIEDSSEAIAPGVVESGKVSQEAFDKARGNAGEEIAKEATDWAPLASGAGMAAKVIEKGIDLENQQRQMNYLNEVAKYNAEQAKVDRATRVAQGLRA